MFITHKRFAVVLCKLTTGLALHDSVTLVQELAKRKRLVSKRNT